jgi:hypothetical protein
MNHEDTKHTKIAMALIDADPYSSRVIGCAIEVPRTLGPGLIESICEAALCHTLRRRDRFRPPAEVARDL